MADGRNWYYHERDSKISTSELALMIFLAWTCFEDEIPQLEQTFHYADGDDDVTKSAKRLIMETISSYQLIDPEITVDMSPVCFITHVLWELVGFKPISIVNIFSVLTLSAA
jgi:hypothetical protein